MGKLEFRWRPSPGNTISFLALLCLVDLDVVLHMLNRQLLSSLRSLGISVGGSIETWDVESFDKDIPPVAACVAHMSTVPTRRHEWVFIDDMKIEWLELGRRRKEHYLYFPFGELRRVIVRKPAPSEFDFASSMFTTADPRAGVASQGASAIVAAPSQTTTAGLSSGLGVPPFQAPKVGGGADATTPLQVLTGQATAAGSTLSIGTFTITTGSVQSGPNGQLTTVPLTITSTGVTLVPVATGGQTASSKCRASDFYYSTRTFRRSFNTHGAVFPSPRCREGNPDFHVQRTDSPKETCDPFDDSNANRESWEPSIDRRPTREHRLSHNTVSTRQLYISNQVNRARQKVAELEEMSTLLRSSTLSSRGSGLRPGSGITATAEGNEEDDSESRSVQETLERAMQQIEALNNRIRELEMHRMRFSADPPDYSE
ncbi:hypothetical protein B0H14DRAFT_3472669 [Mycena olivaceomarginata]|nr:hypothetical protein B0H14DRAFT_3472669 [Mycena olivaceomarginata]